MTSQHLAAKDDRLRSPRTGVRWRPAWRWPDATEDFIREILADCPRPILHVCAGSSPLGDVRADMFHPAADVKADMYNLPFAAGAFGTVVCDPPFPKNGTPVDRRALAFRELGRVVRQGGGSPPTRAVDARRDVGRARGRLVPGIPHAPVPLRRPAPDQVAQDVAARPRDQVAEQDAQAVRPRGRC